MFHNGVEDWAAIITIITILSGWANYLVIKPLKDMMVGQNATLKKIENALEVSQRDIQKLKERVAVVEKEIELVLPLAKGGDDGGPLHK